MAPANSLFLIELFVEKLKSYTKFKEYHITAQFADIFTLHLRDPNIKTGRLSKTSSKMKRIQKTRSKLISQRSSTEPKVEMAQTILFETDIQRLISKMRKYPMELYFFSNEDPHNKLGSINIPWTQEYFRYLKELGKRMEVEPLIVSAEYDVLDDYLSKRMACVKLNIKLSHLRDQIWTSRLLTSETMDTAIHDQVNDDVEDNVYNENTDIIRKTFKGDKTKHEFIKLPGSSIAKSKSDTKNTKALRKSLNSLVRSTTEIQSKKEMSLVRSRSSSTIDYQQRLDMLNYIFGDPYGSFGNRVYCVSYFTVENDLLVDATKSNSPKVESSESLNKGASSGSPGKDYNTEVSFKTEPLVTFAEPPKDYFKFRLCDSECQNKTNDVSRDSSLSVLSLDLPEAASELINVTKCKRVDCEQREFRKPQFPPDERILIDLKDVNKKCCITEKVEEVVGGVTGTMKVGEDPCYCSCECTFGFVKKTTYCTTCGGYEVVGEELVSQKPGQLPFPCPIYHKLTDKNKLKSSVTSSEKKGDERKAVKASSRTGSDKKSVESEKDTKKSKKKKDDRFKFNYGYQAPKIGHSQCAMPCSGTMDPVPKNMGWLWTADNVPGLKFRPTWKPGAVNKKVVRLLRIAKNPEQALAKRRKREPAQKKRPLQRPLLKVHKKTGEYTITMETMKVFNKPRAPNQHPFEDKDPITFTIGRTEEENRIRQKKKERRARRLEREQRDFIQNSFRNMCEDICLKTYQQALGLLPHAEDPDCTCFPAVPGPDDTNLEHSCSCSDTLSTMTSDTDSDEWIVEFSPPNAIYDPSYKGKKVHATDNSCQYTYLDYKVKVLDRFGNPVPRFFVGPDQSQQCSDLGGFWSPDHKWLEINIDGFIAPDGRWAPHNFIGPSGEQVDTDTGKFQNAKGEWLVIGVDGYIDSQGKWKYYIQPKKISQRRFFKMTGAGDKNDRAKMSDADATWSCFGDVTPKQLSRRGIVGHGHDRKLLLTTLQQMVAKGQNVTIPQLSTVTRQAAKKSRTVNPLGSQRSYYYDRLKCKHATPSTKGIAAIDERGHKTYFTLTDYKNQRPNERLTALGGHGISLSSFHVPCLSSFINSEVMRQQQCEHIRQHNAKVMKNVAEQTIYSRQ